MIEMADRILLHPDLALIRFQKRDDQFQSDALAGTAAAENAERLARAHAERHVSQDLLCTKRFRNLIEYDSRRPLIHRALSGKMKKINLIRSTSSRMINKEETTTLLVAAFPTPCAPSFVV